jgi:release factor glutamine methyltransferase
LSSVSGLLKRGADALRAVKVAAPATDARRLLAHALGVEPARLAAMSTDEVAPERQSVFMDMIERRSAGVPVSHIVGYRDFWKLRFRVTPDVLDPRPETETLVELALGAPFSRVLDLGTGTGCIVISLLAEREDARGVGTDISPAAVLVAGENAARAGVADRLLLPVSDWFADVGGRYDLIVSNPPYIAAYEMDGLQVEVREHEPRAALTDEADGLSAYRSIAAGALDHLRPGGRLLVEIGATQGVAVVALFAAARLQEIEVHTDLEGRDRVVEARAAPG